ncbi:gephyrin-like molybdotransferase receptor GlpR [Kitasatospora sp. MAP5-34]|uniref:divisome protein SepX/GlpR n=1 Tax=Kitasatospora sp. MAP5-34 TaxID=3035102 RepID=UPI0024759C06|nr:gephyrin-like molybdotransferase receptor GlpR [Kitasatospora sp. MAP5-34]MDH6577037.1 hypothetical protein [Kitasatospora sp. MAP5-34]
MSSSGLIYAVIVGAWAAYLVPMWLRRQDELNEARPTERFSTAIRLLAGRSALERRASRALGDETRDETRDGTRDEPQGGPEGGDLVPASGAEPEPEPVPDLPSSSPASADGLSSPSAEAERVRSQGEHRERRARLLARRRRMVTTLFLAFAIGAVVAAVSGVAFLWVPALPAALLTLYIGHLRRLERLRYEVKLDRVRAAQAAERLRDRERARAREEQSEPVQRRTARSVTHDAAHPVDTRRPHLRLAVDPGGHEEQPGATASALVEATDHEEWVDGMRERSAAGPDSWEPVPVPLPTYVTAPVAPRVTRGLDLNARGTWDSGRTTEARNTPLFDQYADPSTRLPESDYATRPRAANE